VLTEHGIEAECQYFGTLTAKRFIAYLDVYVLALVVGGKLLIIDNHPVHCAKAVKRFLEDHKMPFAFLPPYSPELNPIEEAFSKINTISENASQGRRKHFSRPSVNPSQRLLRMM